MNELPTLPETSAPPGAAANAGAAASASSMPARAPALRDALKRPLTIAVITLAVLLAAQSWSTHKQVRNLREDVARRLQKGDASNADTGTLARAVQDATKELQAKVGLLENRQSEAQSQQLALEQLYNDLSKNRDEWALAEIEQVLSTASQQLQLAGNVAGALIALQNADRSLSRSDKPQFITIRRAIAKDTEKLKSLPSVDSVGVALRLDAAIAMLDALPMLADETPALPAPKPAKAKAKPPAAKPVAAGAAAPAPAPANPLWLKAQGVWTSWSSEMWTDVRQLIRLRSVETPEALLLSPTQAYFLRENVKLRLLNARLALLSRNETAFRSDLIAAQDALVKYFDTRAQPTQTAQALLRQVQASNLAIDMPTLSESLNAVRNYKAKP
ncbi:MULTISPECIES: uroporphyrinogen-III C-methyltransferase [unclassified Janthinobacterium]|uniref:uroporphyrinogen-III C-methyltransferase n=1 Tax=unclassified Janthinobacterium TaxID=2610881 RepID=UPI00034AC267|nr:MULTISPECIES: uroporphyrinogen-III C-methyltransferase [unclassified Janthinobacterium]MEC5164139.1 uroporphyrin-3 C-methyltransferase [Janthinobacterium sp. CG_S6]